MEKSFYINRPLDCEFSEEEFPHVLSDYKKMIDIFIYLINTIVDNKIKDENWRYFAETLAVKFVLSANTFANIIEAKTIESSLARVSTKIIDVSSLYVMMRTQIENYLTYFYLYMQPDSKEVQRYRFLIYELSGYESRQKFDALTSFTANKQKTERDRIREIITELKGNDIFNSLEEQIQKQILKENRAKIIGWNKLLDESQLSNEVFQKSWNLYSNFAHSEFASLMQVKDFLKEPFKTISTRNLEIYLALLLISVFIKDFSSLYSEIGIRYNLVPINDQKVIDFFNGIARVEVRK